MPDYPKLRLLPDWPASEVEDHDRAPAVIQQPQPVTETVARAPDGTLWAQAMLPVTKREFGQFHAFAGHDLAQANYATARCGEYIPSISPQRLELNSISAVRLCSGCVDDYLPRHTL